MQNILFADTAGRIGLITPGRLPVRRRGDGSLPVDGKEGPARLPGAGRSGFAWRSTRPTAFC